MRGLICLLIAAAVLLAACRASVPPPGPPLPEPDFQVDRSCWDPGRPARPRGKKYDGPIVDTHAHLHVPEEGGLTDQHLGDILAAARQAGVERLIFEPTPNQERFHAFEDGMEGMRRLAGLGPGLAGHHCGSDHMTVWMHFAFRNGFEPAELDRRLGYLKDAGRASYVNVTDDEALEGFQLLCRTEGIIPALESAHAIHHASRLARTLGKDETVLVCLSGRGDKDMDTVIDALGLR